MSLSAGSGHPAAFIFIRCCRFAAVIQVMICEKAEERSGQAQFVICDVQREYAENLMNIISEKLKEEYQFHLQDIKKHEYLIGLAKSTVIFGLILYLFYESFLPGIILFPVWGFYMKEWLEEMTDKKEEEFRVQFKESIQIMAGALKAGYSAENAIRETCHDLKPMYKSESRIIKEYEIMIRKLKIHIPVGQVLSEFAENVEQEDVDNFVTVFTTAQKSGGDSIVIIKDAVKVISEKMETEKEIQTMIASKKLEFEIMSMIPFGMIGYMKLTFGDFLKVLYGNPAGIIVMSICLALYFTAYIWGKKMIKIEV